MGEMKKMNHEEASKWIKDRCDDAKERSKCYLCKNREGTIQINKFGDKICREFNETFDTWFLIQRLKEKGNPTNEIRDAFIISFGNLEVMKRIPVMMTHEKWRNKLRELVFEYISEAEMMMKR
jgi:hypothetical protein